MRADLPSGTVSFLFTDIEGSTSLLQHLGAERYADELAAHRRVIRTAVGRHGGVEVDTQGDAFFVAFTTAPDAVGAAAEIAEALDHGHVRVRMGLHTGTPLVAEEGYVGADVHRAARIAAAGHGGQVLVSQTTAALVDSDVLADLGEHRFKDLRAPERVYQLGHGDFPALRSLYRTNLPVPATPFLGRARELHELVSLLLAPENRIVTLTGPGGTGKTRLAVQAAADVADRFADGVGWVPLAALDDPGLVVPAIARAFDVTEPPNGALAGALDAFLSTHRCLLLLDNCEHLVEIIASTLAPIVRTAPDLVVLATSREPLNLAGEVVVTVDPLERRESVALFVARAQAADRAFSLNADTQEAVDDLCRRLDDLPLAIELAAARVGAIPVRSLLERLSQRLDLLAGPRDAEARQRTLRSTIAWSYDLLTPQERALFEQLAVFAGGATLESCEAVCEGDIGDLLSLTAKSLVRRRDDPNGSPRYWMLETVRAFAREALDLSDAAPRLQQRHVAHFAELSCEALPRLRALDTEWILRLEPDLENVRVALGHALEPETASREAITHLASCLAGLDDLRGRYESAEETLGIALDSADDPLSRGLGHSALGGVLLMRGRPEDAWTAHLAAESELGPPRAEDDHAWWRAWLSVKLAECWHLYWQGDRAGQAQTLATLDEVLARHGTPAELNAAFHLQVTARYRVEQYVPSAETERLAREAYRLAVEIHALGASFMLGFALLWRGALDESEQLLTLALEESARLGDVRRGVQSLSYLTVLKRKRGDVDGASQALARLAEYRDRPGYGGLFLANRAWVAQRRGELNETQRLGLGALAEWDSQGRAGPTVFQWTARFPLLAVAVEAGDLTAAEEHATAMLDGVQQPLPNPVADALHTAVAAATRDAYEQALAAGQADGFS